jgi:hypothetical protein
LGERRLQLAAAILDIGYITELVEEDLHFLRFCLNDPKLDWR